MRWELWFKLPVRIALDLVACIKFMLFDSFADGVAVLKAHYHFIADIPTNFKKRKKINQRAVGGAFPPIYRGSIVFDYFDRGIRKYGRLKTNSTK